MSPKLSKSGTAEPRPKPQKYCVMRYWLAKGVAPVVLATGLTKAEAKARVAATRRTDHPEWFDGYSEDIGG